nr:uncharacterized protein LOC123759090 isoform X2 [Procambarus clarkii]
MLGPYHPTVTLLLLRSRLAHNPPAAASIRRLFSAVNRGPSIRINDFEKRIPVSLPWDQNVLITQRSRPAACGWCYFSDDSGKMTHPEIKEAIKTISEKFTEAMELMNDARASAGTVYFSEDMEDTHTQVTETLEDYTTLLSKLNESQKTEVIQSIV